MKKLEIVIVIVVAVIGALLIYNHFDKKPEQEVIVNKFTSEYAIVPEDNIYTYKTIDEVITLLSEGTGVVFMCTPTSTWCHSYAYYLNDVLKKQGLNEIYYLNVKADRDLNTIKYQKLLEYLDPFLYKDDQNVGKIYMPNVTFVRNGIVRANDNETALVQSDVNPENYWTQETINAFELKIKNYLYLINSEEETYE